MLKGHTTSPIGGSREEKEGVINERQEKKVYLYLQRGGRVGFVEGVGLTPTSAEGK
jgi:hypothetical protein